MTAPTLDVDLSIFAPTTSAPPKDPYNGFGQEEYERREAEKQAIRTRQREMRQLARDPQTPNRATWHCVRCFKPIGRGETVYLHYTPQILFFTMKCADCHDAMTTEDAAPSRRATLIQEVL